ncbi:MAG: cytochrome-c oxidase, cbb3-type subunit III [Litoreibacter sp.]|uniref:cytochrome-c oxidase, cbb3-type subunit III n=1 Tax=Litoreibacter sp. TaxID=1969459 RepID=UPI0032968951
MSDQKIDEETGVETTGHSWDGIQELNNPLPRWWLWTLYLSIIWAIGYTVYYPAWPLVTGATAGISEWSTRNQVAEDIAAHQEQNAELVAALVVADMETIAEDTSLNRYAIARGRSAFLAQCSQCHGSGAAGAVGYPNLLDNDWLWGGSMNEIMHTVRHGVRNETDPDAHWSEMPAFGEILTSEEISAAVEYVVSLSSTEYDTSLADTGALLFSDNCAVCHGDNAQGDRDIGAPNLTDAIWLYGGDRASLTETVEYARFGVMPAWGQRLSEEDVRSLSAYVHALGGGE